MSGEQYRASIERLGLNITTAAEFLGVDVRTSRRYANGGLPIPRVVANFLSYAIAKEGNP